MQMVLCQLYPQNRLCGAIGTDELEDDIADEDDRVGPVRSIPRHATHFISNS